MDANFSAVSYARSLADDDLEQVRRVLAGAGAVLGREERLQEQPFAVCTMELRLAAGPDSSGLPSLATVRRRLLDAGMAGTAVVPVALRTAKRKLIIMDVDSTLIQQEVIELLAAHAGAEAEVAEVTAAAMRGELDFAQSLHARVATLAGLPESVLADVGAKVLLTEGAERLVAAARAGGHLVCAVSGGFSRILAPLAGQLGLDHALANELELQDGFLTGRVSGPVVDRTAKEAALRQWSSAASIPLEHTVAIGDGANDLDMLAAAGIGIAYNAKPAVREAADAQINIPYLDAARFIAGL